MARKRLVRPRQGRKIAGVCLGFAEYFDLDVSVVRIVWAITILFGMFGAVAYVAAWIVMPEEPYMLTAPETSRDRVVNT
ncbi:MAG TPA: PspC domain-containing protein [Candidatus Angelobacter sp.]|nr:PspC domain-containing protein [Candidatus Angelobacter sp.]